MEKWRDTLGFKATYKKLLEVCVEREKTKTSEKIGILLGASGMKFHILFFQMLKLLNFRHSRSETSISSRITITDSKLVIS